jgi:hypothetical protein
MKPMYKKRPECTPIKKKNEKKFKMKWKPQKSKQQVRENGKWKGELLDLNAP